MTHINFGKLMKFINNLELLQLGRVCFVEIAEESMNTVMRSVEKRATA